MKVTPINIVINIYNLKAQMAVCILYYFALVYCIAYL